VSGWLAALEAFDAAAHTSDWRSSALTATHIDPQRSVVVSQLRSLSRAGIVAQGSEHLVNVRVLSVNGTSAEVLGCVIDDEVDVYSSTGRPVAGPAGKAGPDVIWSEMSETSTGWKVDSETTEEESCPAT
jgi:hypothetical protein